MNTDNPALFIGAAAALGFFGGVGVVVGVGILRTMRRYLRKDNGNGYGP